GRKDGKTERRKDGRTGGREDGRTEGYPVRYSMSGRSGNPRSPSPIKDSRPPDLPECPPICVNLRNLRFPLIITALCPRPSAWRPPFLPCEHALPRRPQFRRKGRPAPSGRGCAWCAGG